MNHREIDKEVAEFLGYDVFEVDGEYWVAADDETADSLDYFSTTGDGMLCLIEEARRQGIYLDPSHYPEGWRVDALKLDGDGIMSLVVTPLPVIIKSLPLATALSFLKAKGVDITPYLEGEAAE